MLLFLTRLQIEQRLEKGLLNQTISWEAPDSTIKTGKVQKLAVEDSLNGEVMVLFQLKDGEALVSYSSDLNYFIENTILYGNTQPGDGRNIGRLLERD